MEYHAACDACGWERRDLPSGAAAYDACREHTKRVCPGRVEWQVDQGDDLRTETGRI